MHAIDKCTTLASSVSFFAQDLKPHFAIFHVVQAADDVNAYLKVIRTIISCANKWIKISDNIVKVIKYTKFVSSLYGLFAAQKLISSAVVCSNATCALTAGRALWPVLNNTKKVISSLCWFANAAADVGLISGKKIAWMSCVVVIDVPFKLVSLGVCILRIGKLVVIWLELERYKVLIRESRRENRPRNCYIITAYLDRSHTRLTKELKLSPKNRLDRQVELLNHYLGRREPFLHTSALERSDQILTRLQILVQKRAVGELINTGAKIVDLGSSFFATTCPGFLFSLSLLSTLATGLKMAKHFYGKYQTPKNAMLWANPSPISRTMHATVTCKTA